MAQNDLKQTTILAILLLGTYLSLRLFTDKTPLKTQLTQRCSNAWSEETTRVLTSPYCKSSGALAGVPSSPSFCKPTKPWYYLDGGGNTCICENTWDSTLYASKLFRGFAYNVPHVTMPMTAYILSGRLWVAYFIVTFTEILEEVLASTGTWGFFSEVGMLNQEPRYDSLVRDCLVSAIPGYITSHIIVKTFGLEPSSFLTGRIIHDTGVAFAYFSVNMWVEISTRGHAGIYTLNNTIWASLAGLAATLVFIAHTCGKDVETQTYTAWYLTITAFVIPQIYPVTDEIAGIYFSFGLTLCAFATYHYIEYRRNPTKKDTDNQSKIIHMTTLQRTTNTTFADVGDWISSEPVSIYIMTAVAILSIILAATNFFTVPVPPDAIAYLRRWCGMGTLRQISDPALGGSPCEFLIHNET